MPNIAIIGAQWGDEGKGKITDFLAEKADYIVRYQGGDNAGHTIYVKGQKFSLHLLPSGVIRKGAINILGNGMVINPESLIKELDTLSALGITPNIKISNRAHVIMPYHKKRDQLAEEDQNIGTTLKGIGPAYMDKAKRVGLRMGTFVNVELFKAYLEKNRDQVSEDPLNIDDLLKDYIPMIDRLKDYVEDTSLVLEKAIQKGLKIVFEGAQGTMLDIDHGTYPYVTSSSPSAWRRAFCQ